jgi:predicted neutral ceramidase superfamily lipid hydrolase
VSTDPDYCFFVIHQSLNKSYLSFQPEGISLILLVIVSLALQVANIYVGQAYRDKCPIEPSIPIWLTVYSIGIVFLIIDLIILVKLELRRNFFIFVLLIALLLFWFIKGK